MFGKQTICHDGDDDEFHRNAFVLYPEPHFSQSDCEYSVIDARCE